MANEVRNVGGVGMNTRFDVYSDGKIVGRIGRHGNGVRVYGHYDLRLAGFNSFPDARAAAQTLVFPTEADAYEQVCARVEANRRSVVEQKFGPKFAELARALVDGSNSAADEIKDLATEMEKLVKDRLHSSRKPENARTGQWEVEFLLGKPVAWGFGSDCVYPKAPGSQA